VGGTVCSGTDELLPINSLNTAIQNLHSSGIHLEELLQMANRYQNPYTARLDTEFFSKNIGRSEHGTPQNAIPINNPNFYHMRIPFLLLLSFFSHFLFSQDCEYQPCTFCDFQADYSNMWLGTTFQGTIGNGNQRIEVRFLSIEKAEGIPNQYRISGKSKVNAHICDFSGTLTLQQEYILDPSNPYCEGPDYFDGYIVGAYLLKENPNQQHVGEFRGTLKSYVDVSSGSPRAARGWISDEGMHEFRGEWQAYGASSGKYCSWGMQIPPTQKGDLFKPYDNEYYIFNADFLDQGWRSYVVSNLGSFISIPTDFFHEGPRFTEDFIETFSKAEIQRQRDIEEREWWK